MKKVVFYLFFTLNYSFGFCQSISVAGNWPVSVLASTISEAGSDYSSNQTSSASQTLIGVTMPLLGLGSINNNYKVTVNKSDTDWNSTLTLWIRKTGDGSGALGAVSPSGTTSYLQLTNSAQDFFSGYNLIVARSGVPIQYEIRGLTVLLPVKSYTTTVVFTLIDI